VAVPRDLHRPGLRRVNLPRGGHHAAAALRAAAPGLPAVRQVPPVLELRGAAGRLAEPRTESEPGAAERAVPAQSRPGLSLPEQVRGADEDVAQELAGALGRQPQPGQRPAAAALGQAGVAHDAHRRAQDLQALHQHQHQVGDVKGPKGRDVMRWVAGPLP
jgi:hypothetical protein